MGNRYPGIIPEEEQIELPPGFRFHPTDEELITHYLSPKVANRSFNAIAIGEADLNKSEPWDLPGRAKMGEKEWYFFCVKDRKYPTGMRTNRATESGYWKATGKDKEIYRGKRVVGMKKTLVFYRGRAPKGTKSNWVMHEYRLEGKPLHLLKTTKNEWVICRIFNKSSGEKRTHISDLVRLSPFDTASPLPPLTEFSYTPYTSDARAPHVTSFSNIPLDDHDTKPQAADAIYTFKTPPFFSPFLSSAINDPHEAPGNSVLRKLREFPPGVGEGSGAGVISSVTSCHGMMGDMIYMEDEELSDQPIDLESFWNY